jgi:hypothetical protein
LSLNGREYKNCAVHFALAGKEIYAYAYYLEPHPAGEKKLLHDYSCSGFNQSTVFHRNPKNYHNG